MTDSIRWTAPEEHEEDSVLEKSLRPNTLNEYIGQSALKNNLRVFIQAAIMREEPLDHTLFYGPPGLGKTTLAQIIGKEMGGTIRMTAGPSIEKSGDLAALLTNLEYGDVLFIDEIHRLGRALEEILYPAMEDFVLDLIVGSGPAARTVRLELPKFTLVGATTRVGALSSPLRDRFGIVEHLEYYSIAELTEVALRSAEILKVPLEAEAAGVIAKRSRGTPRVVNRLLRRVRDFAEVGKHHEVALELAESALSKMGVDEFGLDDVDRAILNAIQMKFSGGPVGIAAIAASTGEDRETIETIYEPYLMQIGFLDRTPRGRQITMAAREHLANKHI